MAKIKKYFVYVSQIERRTVEVVVEAGNKSDAGRRAAMLVRTGRARDEDGRRIGRSSFDKEPAEIDSGYEVEVGTSFYEEE